MYLFSGNLVNMKSEFTSENQICDLFWDGFESYWCSEYHKCHCLVERDNMMCIMYTANIPTCTAR